MFQFALLTIQLIVTKAWLAGLEYIRLFVSCGIAKQYSIKYDVYVLAKILAQFTDSLS